MAKKLTDRIAERVANRKPNRRAKNLAAFLANKTEIESALRDRWSVRVIWETLKSEGRISVSYQAFNNYVNQHIKTQSDIKEKTTATQKNEPIDVNKKRQLKGFTFDSTPNKEDLI